MTATLPQVYTSVVHMLVAAAEATPDAEALVEGRTRLTYREYVSCVAAFAAELATHGVRGERVATILPNSIDACIAAFGILAAGAQHVPLNPLYTPREIGEILSDAAARVLIATDDAAPGLASLAERAGIGTLIALGPRTRSLAALRASPAPLERLPDSDALALLQYTGGTTGRAKGVNLSHRAIATNVAQREGLLPTGIGERVLCSMPLFHAYAMAMGLFLAANCRGSLVVLPRYDPEKLLEAIEEERITVFPGSPTIYVGLMAHPNFARTGWSRVHTCYSGAAPLAEQVLRRWEAAVGAPILEGYGQTEAGPVLSFNPLHGVRKPGSVGIPVAATEIEIVDVETGVRVLAQGERGEIRARGPQIMQGYRNLPTETAEALRGGWLYTGDIGELDADGYLTIRDRKKDMVIVGGYNVYPREVEEVLFAHPAVMEAAAVGAPDEYRGEIVRAYAVLKPGALASEEELLAHCRANLAKYKVPASIERLEAIPKTAVNKTDKQALRRRASGGGL
ncbi:MAG: long-chain fatty acid--CoA ligase [Betaproteobacteria bacterium]|nr:long-chain fatty acid--CoA ligase [Betaproteobacteria bacterium]